MLYLSVSGQYLSKFHQGLESIPLLHSTVPLDLNVEVWWWKNYIQYPQFSLAWCLLSWTAQCRKGLEIECNLWTGKESSGPFCSFLLVLHTKQRKGGYVVLLPLIHDKWDPKSRLHLAQESATSWWQRVCLELLKKKEKTNCSFKFFRQKSFFVEGIVVY